MELENIIDGIILAKRFMECVGKYKSDSKYYLMYSERGDRECVLCQKMYNYIKKYSINKFLF